MLGDLVNAKGEFLEEEIEFWERDPMECIRDLIQNPLFKDQMAYAPEKVYRDAGGKTRVYDEMWTGDWWWEIQVSDLIKVIEMKEKSTYKIG